VQFGFVSGCDLHKMWGSQLWRQPAFAIHGMQSGGLNSCNGSGWGRQSRLQAAFQATVETETDRSHSSRIFLRLRV
jgi:hypothetical protein